MKYKIDDLTIDEVNIIISGLLELPGKFGLNVISKIKQQIEEQGAQSAERPQGPLGDKVVN
jgi:hypothetical protein